MPCIEYLGSESGQAACKTILPENSTGKHAEKELSGIRHVLPQEYLFHLLHTVLYLSHYTQCAHHILIGVGDILVTLLYDAVYQIPGYLKTFEVINDPLRIIIVQCGKEPVKHRRILIQRVCRCGMVSVSDIAPSATTAATAVLLYLFNLNGDLTKVAVDAVCRFAPSSCFVNSIQFHISCSTFTIPHPDALQRTDDSLF